MRETRVGFDRVERLLIFQQDTNNAFAIHLEPGDVYTLVQHYSHKFSEFGTDCELRRAKHDGDGSTQFY